MKAGEEPPIELETLLQVEQPVSDVQQEAAPEAMNVGLVIVFAVILAAVAISNVWLRKRAERRRS